MATCCNSLSSRLGRPFRLQLRNSSRGALLTHPHIPQLSRLRPRNRLAVHFSRLFTGECESSRLLFLGCRERPEGLFRGRSCWFCGLRVAGGWVWGLEIS
jgi:hypothetical protein